MIINLSIFKQIIFAISKKYKNVDRSNSLFSFKTKKARTKIYNDSFVQKCIRTLRDDFEKQELYRLTSSKLRSESKRTWENGKNKS